RRGEGEVCPPRAQIRKAPASEDRQGGGKRAEGEGRFDPSDVRAGKDERAGTGVLGGVRDARRLRNREDRGAARQEGERHLPRRRSVRRGDLRKDPPARAVGRGEATGVSEGRV